jgi:hypothetical protein
MRALMLSTVIWSRVMSVFDVRHRVVAFAEDWADRNLNDLAQR